MTPPPSGTADAPLLAIEGIGKSFGALRALDRVSLTAARGSLTILAGADGAGKSTLFRILVGLTRSDQGTVRLRGEAMKRDFTPITSITGYMPERFSLYPDLTVAENLDFFADVHRVARGRRDELKHRLLAQTGMLPFTKRRAGALSGGMKQKLALSCILLASPELIILDEPTTGVDPLSRMEFFAIVEELKAEGRTILMSTPYLDEAERGDRIVFLKEGRVIGGGAIADLRADFPATLWKVTPPRNPLEFQQRIAADPRLAGSVYLRGQSLRFQGEKGSATAPLFPDCRVEPVTPTLEDIYLLMERDSTSGGDRCRP